MSEETDNDAILTDEEIEALVEHAEDGGFDDGQFRIHDFSAGESLTLSKWVETETSVAASSSTPIEEVPLARREIKCEYDMLMLVWSFLQAEVPVHAA